MMKSVALVLAFAAACNAAPMDGDPLLDEAEVRCDKNPGHTRCDVEPPIVEIIAPSSGATVSNGVVVEGTASDNRQVSRVEVRIDDGAWMPASGTTAFSLFVDTTAVPDGNHLLTARATDPAGNAGTDTVSVLVANQGASCTGVRVDPGQSIQALVDAHPEGTTFCLAAGVHRRQDVRPKRGDQFLGAPGAVLDGEDTAVHAFRPTADQVTIRGLVIERYANPPQLGAILGGGHQASDGRYDWVVEDNEIRWNASQGVRIGHRMILRNNRIHHNRQMGLGGVGNGARIEDNEIAYNNYNWDFDPGWEAGGMKIVMSTGVVVRGNWAHHNNGPGLWTDGWNDDILYEANLVEDNSGDGIFHEISFRATIRYNVLRRNGHGSAGWCYGSGILAAHSPDVTVYENELVDNWNGIVGLQQARPEAGDFRLRNFHVHDNRITYTTSFPRDGSGNGVVAGAVCIDQGAMDLWGLAIFREWNNRFERNHYVVPDTGAGWWSWENRRLTWPGWQSFGHDLAGSLERLP